MTRVAGKDASKQFWKYHNEGILKKYKPQLLVGSLDSKPKEAAAPAQPQADEKKPEKKAELPPSERKVAQPSAESGVVAPMAGPAAELLAEPSEALEQYGDMVPFGDPGWYHTVSTASYNRDFISACLF